jgi:hypothetical protein
MTALWHAKPNIYHLMTTIIKVILPADSSWSGLFVIVAEFKIFTKYQPQNVYGSEENRMFITYISKNSLYFWL